MAIYPTGVQWLGILFAISGAIVMSLDLNCCNGYKKVPLSQENQYEADVYVKYRDIESTLESGSTK